MRQDALRQDSVDAVDRIVAQWTRERPDLDPSAKEITGRIVRLESLFQQRFAEVFAEFGMKEGDYGLLVALRRAGTPYELTPTGLAKARMMSSGGLTPALDRLQRREWIERAPNPEDRRGMLVRLTPAGKELVDAAMHAHIAAEHDLVRHLSPTKRRQLTTLLRELLMSVERA
jgi:DNA-binding MarR family transcriptional regulator